MAKKNEYGGESIKILEGLEAVRKRPGMYIGTTSASGLHHLVWEIVDNSVDEAMAGFCSKIKVTVHPDNSITVDDNGRGIPVEKHPVKKIPTLEVVLTILHAGGKFDNNAYKVSGGLHGVGVSVVNALSKKLVAQVKRDGKIYEMAFERGKTVQKMKVVGTSKATGTSITFWPDEEIFETTTYSYDTLHDHLQETAFLNKNLKIVLVDERELTPRTDEFCYAGGIIDFVKFLNNEKDILPGLSRPIYIEGRSAADAPESQMGEVEVSMQWNTGYSEHTLSFANDIYTEEGGMHLEGFRTALTKVINDYGRRQNIIKEKDANLTGDDIREGHRRRHPRGSHGGHLRQASRPPVRGSDQGQARQLLHAHAREPHRVPGACRVPRGAPQPGPRDPQEGEPGRQGTPRRPEGPSGHAPQEPARERGASRQAGRLLRARPRDDRALHRGGRLRRWLGQGRSPS